MPLIHKISIGPPKIVPLENADAETGAHLRPRPHILTTHMERRRLPHET
jgi:hypothetical protein